jgi:hypothetical protein
MSEENKNEITFIKEPLSLEEIKKQMQENDEINVNVLISVNDMIDRDSEAFDEWMDKIIVNDFSIISGIQYEPISIHEGNIILNVTGYIEDWEEKLQEDEEEPEEYNPYHHEYQGREYNDGDDDFDFPPDDYPDTDE